MSKHDKRIHLHTISFKARLVEAKRLCQVLERNFGARQIRIQSIASSEEPKLLRPNWRPRAGSIGAKILAILDDNKVHSRAEIASLLPGVAVGAALRKLVDVGAAVSPSWGYYAGASVDVSEFVRPMGSREQLGPALRAVLDKLEQPRSAIELKELLGGTRQAIDQKLKQLRRLKLIKRVDALGERGRYVYLKISDRADQVLLHRPPLLKDHAAKVLSTLLPDKAAKLSDITGTGNSAIYPRKILSSLMRQGLIEWSGSRNRRIVRLTNLGRQHPQYNILAPKAPALRDSLVPTDALRILLAIHGLGEARSIDVTLVLGLRLRKQSRGAKTGQHIQQLEGGGFIEPVGNAVGRHPCYRLTSAGLSYVMTVRAEIDFPNPEELRAKLDEERRLFHEAQRDRGRSKKLDLTGNRYGAILAALRQHGPLATTAINGYLTNPYSDPRSVYLAMRTLLTYGLVVVLRPHDSVRKVPTLWGLSSEHTNNVEGDASTGPAFRQQPIVIKQPCRSEGR